VSTPALFLDRDGVINELAFDPVDGRCESPLRPEDAHLVPGAAAALRTLQDGDALMVVVSNQPAAAKGKATLADLRAVHDRIVELLAQEGVRIADWRYCHHHPEAVMPELRGPCGCRKPQPGMLLDAAREHDIDLGRSWMIGDSDADVEAGRAAGCRTILIEHPGSAHRRSADVRPTTRARDLRTAGTLLAA
jgi:D-glycero-D-manno-heptose 1,7-bisphosphate phosphatase